MRKIARAAFGAAMLLSTTGAAVDLAFAAPEDDMLAVVFQRDRIDSTMGDLPGVFVAAPPEGVLGVQVRREPLPESVYLDMLRTIGQRADREREQAELPR
jgi:hypothetical protein